MALWEWLFRRRNGRMRKLTKVGIPLPRVNKWDFVKEGVILLLLLVQAITVLGASSDWEVESPGGGANPYGDFVGYVGAIYAVVETMDVAADAALAYCVKENIEGPKLLAAVARHDSAERLNVQRCTAMAGFSFPRIALPFHDRWRSRCRTCSAFLCSA